MLSKFNSVGVDSITVLGVSCFHKTYFQYMNNYVYIISGRIELPHLNK